MRKWRRTAALTAAIATIALGLVGYTAAVNRATPAAASTGSVVLTPVADAYVSSSHKTTNYGTTNPLIVSAAVNRGLLKFSTASALPGGATLTAATLSVYNTNRAATTGGYQFHPEGDSWTESGVNWNNQPAWNASVLATSALPTANARTDTIIPASAVNLNGNTDFGIRYTTTGVNQKFQSREAAHKPQLTLTYTLPDHTNTALPARGAFYYPWYPETWTQGSTFPATHYNPSLGFYNTTDVLAQHVQSLVYGGFDFALSSWWGQGSQTDQRLGPFLTAAHGTSLKVAPYYEAEGNTIANEAGSPNPTSAQITDDLNYLAANYTSDPNYMYVNGKPVIFAFGDGSDSCGMADRWNAANAAASQQFYVVLKVFGGYGACTTQPDNWHQYGPAVAEDSQGSHSFTISPGFWRYDETTPRLARDTATWHTNVTDMNCSAADFRLVTTFNEWGEGTAVESANEWSTPSGQGAYLDELHSNTTCNSTPSPSPTPTTPSPTPSITPTPSPSPSITPTSPPPPSGHKVMVILEENHSRAEALAQMPHLASYANQYGQATQYFAIGHPSLPNYFEIWGGSNFGVSSDCGVGSSGCIPSPPSVWGQTISAGGTAKAYQEDMTSNCQTGSSGGYVARHGPWPYWTDATERAQCQQGDVPMGTTASGNLLNDINSGSLPVTGEMTPNLCNDGHDCTNLTTADNWLNGWLPVIMAGPDYQAGNLTIIVTFDEDDGSQGNNVDFVVIDPRLSGVTVTGTFNHYSLTKWLEDNAGVAELRNAATAPDLRAAFGLG